MKDLFAELDADNSGDVDIGELMGGLKAIEGFPTLPPCDITLIRAAAAIDPVHDALCAHIQAAIGNVSMQMAAAAE